ncbi:hypothetical protein [Caldimonas sp. KR1-144]|uniref:hypothetical protein n=1 Tax=Caldimonas sp. KR1-144 TaxID=3400911 RepID=UPI003C1080BB
MSNLTEELEKKIVDAARRQSQTHADTAFTPAFTYTYELDRLLDRWEQRLFPIRARVGEIKSQMLKLREELAQIHQAQLAETMRAKVADEAATVLVKMLGA